MIIQISAGARFVDKFASNASQRFRLHQAWLGMSSALNVFRTKLGAGPFRLLSLTTRAIEESLRCG
jgi:hypothetical protein